MHVSKKQLFSLVFFIVLLFALPVAVFLVQKRQDIRPRALQGQANLLLSSDKNSSSVGESINVLVTMQLVGSDLRVSGVDFMILYDKEKLDVINITPSLQNVIAGGFFTEAPVVTSGGRFDDTYNFLRVVELAKMRDVNLPIGSVMLANITFRSIGEGTAVVKFPEDNKYIEIIGTGIPSVIPPGPAGLAGWWKME